LTTFVVDSSVALKWFVPEEHSDSAARLLDGGVDLLAPDLLFAEIGNVLWKKARRGEIDGGQAQAVLLALEAVPLDVVPSQDLAGGALRIALETSRTVYDALYVALAVAGGCPLVTADERLANGLSTGPYGPSVRWLGDLDRQ
jgi:predicted nucleic acid-binding protein